MLSSCDFHVFLISLDH